MTEVLIRRSTNARTYHDRASSECKTRVANKICSSRDKEAIFYFSTIISLTVTSTFFAVLPLLASNSSSVVSSIRHSPSSSAGYVLDHHSTRRAS